MQGFRLFQPFFGLFDFLLLSLTRCVKTKCFGRSCLPPRALRQQGDDCGGRNAQGAEPSHAEEGAVLDHAP
jgi:hypothetical protein